MIRISKTSLSLSTVIFFALSIFVVDLKAQCVNCTTAPPGWICTGTGRAGGQGCTTAPDSCTVFGSCAGGGGDVPPIEDGGGSRTGKCSVKGLENPLISVSDSLVREVAGYDPFAALALIRIRNIRAEFKEGKVNFAPIDFDETDVENQLTASPDSDYFKNLKERSKTAYARKSDPIVYEFVVNESDTGAILQIKSANSKSSKSPVEIGLIKVSEDLAGKGSSRFEGTSLKNK